MYMHCSISARSHRLTRFYNFLKVDLFSFSLFFIEHSCEWTLERVCTCSYQYVYYDWEVSTVEGGWGPPPWVFGFTPPPPPPTHTHTHTQTPTLPLLPLSTFWTQLAITCITSLYPYPSLLSNKLTLCMKHSVPHNNICCICTNNHTLPGIDHHITVVYCTSW